MSSSPNAKWPSETASGRTKTFAVTLSGGGSGGVGAVGGVGFMSPPQAAVSSISPSVDIESTRCNAGMTFSAGRKRSPLQNKTGRAQSFQKVFADRREDIDQHHFLIEHRRAMPETTGQEDDVAWAEDALLGAENEADAAAFDKRNLFVHVLVRGGDGAGCEGQAAHHQRAAVDHLAGDPFGDRLGGDRVPVPAGERCVEGGGHR